MISILKRWFGGGHDERKSTKISPPPRTRRSYENYRPELVPTLHAEHRQLLALFALVQQACESDDDIACRNAVNRFGQLLREHLLTENRYLYGYFARHLHPDPTAARRITAMSMEMLRIGKPLHHFISTYTRGAWTAEQRRQLPADLCNIGAILRHRIAEEERLLYPLYVPPVG